MLSSIYYNDTDKHLNPRKSCCRPWLLFDSKPNRRKRESCETNQGYWKCFQGSLKRRQNPFSQYGAIILISLCHCHCHFDHNHDRCNCHCFFSLALVFLGAIAMFANVIVILTIWLCVPLFLSLLLKLLFSLNWRYNPFSQYEVIIGLPGGSSEKGMYVHLAFGMKGR